MSWPFPLHCSKAAVEPNTKSQTVGWIIADDGSLCSVVSHRNNSINDTHSPMIRHQTDSIPIWTWLAPVLTCGLLALNYLGLVSADATIVLLLASMLLGASIFAAVHHAEILALKIGEPFGSILLAVAVTVIEVALIVSIMLSGAPGGESVARDTIFAAVMIVLNGVIGISLVLGGQRHFEQTFQLQGASSALAVLGTLSVLVLILPNYTLAEVGPSYSRFQLLFVGVISFALWWIFVFVQTVKHRDYFLDVPANEHVEAEVLVTEPLFESEAASGLPSDRIALASFGLLLLSLTTVVLLAKLLSGPLDKAIAAAALPKAFVGVIIAAIVLLPEGIAAARSALLNRLQNSINLSLGSALASIGLTIPAVTAVSLVFDQKLVLGITASNTTLLILTLFVSTLTLGTGRTTVLQGAVHLVIFAVFILVSAVP
jgi:Ca2+:H+ antiporter